MERDSPWQQIRHERLGYLLCPQLENSRRLVRALAPYHPRLRGLPKGLPFIWDQATLRDGTIIRLDTDLGKIDLLAEVAGLGPSTR